MTGLLQSILDCSIGTILKHIQAYKDRRDLTATVDSCLSDSFMQAAKAQMQVERADRAAALAEEKMKVLEGKLAAALAANTDLEKCLSVTEAKREALEATERTRTTEDKERIEELKQELSGIKIALEEERKGRVEAEKQLAGREPGQPKKETKEK